MDVGVKDMILAIVASDKESIESSSVPIFYVQDKEEGERLALLVSKVTMGMVHYLGSGIYVIVKH
ncbi:MAG: hypothetical protein WC996_07575 [Peptostreptococcales bacterium]|jgi:hypothetical protein